MRDYDENFEDRQHSKVLDREERAWEKNKELVEAMAVQSRKFIAEALRNDLTKQNLAKEGYDANSRYKNGADNDLRNRMDRIDGYGGVYKGYDDQEIITGLEDRPWERD